MERTVGRTDPNERVCLFSSWPQPISRCALKNSYEWLRNKRTACPFARQKRLREEGILFDQEGRRVVADAEGKLFQMLRADSMLTPRLYLGS